VRGGFSNRQHAISADFGRLTEAREFAARAAREFGFGEADLYAVKLAMSEAVTNAIQHGSRSTGDTVRITALVDGDALVFEVKDSGWFAQPGARRADGRLGGWGLEFMRRLMDEVDVHPGRDGTLLRFSKRR
jgi:serine/threonine-protein kinase RsbW